MSGDDPAARPAPHPRPQYGEYATPEQQQERIRLGGGEPGPVHPPVVERAPVVPAAVPAAEPGAVPPRRGDRIVTIALLAYGLYTVVTTVPQLLDYAAFATTWLDMAGIDAEFTAFAEGRLWGGIGAALFAVGWLLTALLSWRTLSRGRISWWIPLVGALVTTIAVSICLSVPLLSDPAIIEQVLRTR